MNRAEDRRYLSNKSKGEITSSRRDFHPLYHEFSFCQSHIICRVKKEYKQHSFDLLQSNQFRSKIASISNKLQQNSPL